MSSIAPANHRRLPTLMGLQYARGAAAFAVVIFHAASRAKMNFVVGEAGVDLFFLLSGFLMVNISKDDTKPAVFLLDRAKRIVPSYWIATTVFLIGALAGLFPQVHLSTWHTVASYLFIPARSPSNGMAWPLLVPGWTLNCEMMFYTAFAASMVLKGKRTRVVAMSCLFASLVIAGWWWRPMNALPRVYTQPIILEFVAGGWLALWWKSSEPRPAWLGLVLIGAALCSLGVAHHLMITDKFRLLVFGVPAALMLIGTLILEQGKKVPTWPAFLLLGDASYSIYLWHTLIISITAKLLAYAGISPLLTVVIGSGAGVAGGILAYKLIEKPIIRYFRQRRFASGVTIPSGP